jgi:hypothetical protein
MRLAAFLLLLSLSVARANDEQEMHEVLSENFVACNEEDVDALMDTCSVDMPDREQFRRESEILFREKDIHYSLQDFKVTKIRGDYAEAWVVQRTYADNRSSDSEDRESFRNGTTLLPKDECVEYRVAFKRDGSRWKCLATISEPIPYRAERRPAVAR